MTMSDRQWEEIEEVFCFVHHEEHDLRKALQAVLRIELPRRASVVPMYMGSEETAVLRSIVAAHFGMRVKDLLSGHKHRRWAEPRFVVM
jgi:chromosomal replication initiation ATPase DnaA